MGQICGAHWIRWPEPTRLKAAGEVETVALARVEGAAKMNE